MNCYMCDYDMGILQGTDKLYCPQHIVPVLHRYGALTNVLLRVTFNVVIGHEEFQVVLRPFEERTEINRVDGFVSANGNIFELPTEIYKCGYVIHITPESAPYKIKTILTFS